jgi:hypothetical protein
MRVPLAFDDAPVTVETEDEDALAWLEEFLWPSFRAVPERSGAPLVRLVVDAGRHAEERRRAAASPRTPHACFSLDTETVVLDGHDDGDVRVLEDARYGCFLRFLPDGVEVVAAPASRNRHLPLLRVVREVAATAFARAPGRPRLSLHAAGVVVEGRAVLFAGEKEAGKTTLLLHALRGGAEYLANDRVFLTLDDPVEARGVPTVVSIRPGTLARFPEVLRGVPERRHPSQLRVAELGVGGPGHPPDQRLRLSPAVFVRQAGAVAVAAAPLASVWVCRLDPEVGTRRLERLAEPAARRALARCLYGRAAGEGRPTVFERFGAGAIPDARELLDALARRVAVWDCRLGPRAYDAPLVDAAVLGDGAAARTVP